MRVLPRFLYGSPYYPVVTSKRIDRAPDTSRTVVEDMGKDHRRLPVAMAQELPHGSDVVTTLQ